MKKIRKHDHVIAYVLSGELLRARRRAGISPSELTGLPRTHQREREYFTQYYTMLLLWLLEEDITFGGHLEAGRSNHVEQKVRSGHLLFFVLK